MLIKVKLRKRKIYNTWCETAWDNCKKYSGLARWLETIWAMIVSKDDEQRRQSKDQSLGSEWRRYDPQE
jgi:hypothetical protein